MSDFRKEHDTMGELLVPEDAYYGIQTERAVENFKISHLKAYPHFIKATAIIKKCAAEANIAAGKLDKKIGGAIISAAEEVVKGGFASEFVVDVFQAGAGTSHNMNMNEVIANRAIEILGGTKGDYKTVHPNDHVNMSQSTNDVFPTAMRISAFSAVSEFLPVLEDLCNSLLSKANEFDDIIKSGRTHLQDAVPIRLGQEFNGYGLSLKRWHKRIEDASNRLKDLAIGGTAVGTGINTHPLYRKKMIEFLNKETGFGFQAAEDMIELTQSMGDFVALSSSLKGLSCDLIKIANDLRLLSSGPMTGFDEIILPPVQPGSSIMPGKVNPVIAEVMNMVSFQVIGNDLVITTAAQAGQLELNVMMPVINFNLLFSIDILKNCLSIFSSKCIQGIAANKERCKRFADTTIGLATVLNPYIGYEKAALVAKEAASSGKRVRDIIIEKGILSKEEIDKILETRNIT